MNKQSDLMKIVCNEPIKDSHPELNRVESTKAYDITEIYDHPAPYSTVRGIFTYTGVDVI